jgi:uncharacterized heparinase superfamily protein
MKVGLYFHTIKYLKLKQVVFQVLRRIYNPRIKTVRSSPEVRTGKIKPLAPILSRVSLVGSTEFEFYGEVGELSVIHWQGEQKEDIWRYNQHYFDDLNAKGSEDRREWHKSLLHDWVNKNNYKNSIGWDAYPLSLRIVNWVKWDLRTHELPFFCRKSMFSQGLVLEKKIEHHILGNHIFSNAKALVFLGCYFEGIEAHRWLRKGFKIISKELDIQVLADGGHYELSPMYHCLFLEDVLDLINILRAYAFDSRWKVLESLESVVPRMLFWMQQMTFPDGGVSCFNDSANNVAAIPKDIQEYASRLGFEETEPVSSEKITYCHLSESGYIALTKNKLKMIMDVACLGPDYLLAHAHADTLSFELSLGTHRVFVNSGTSCYGTSERRQLERSTRAHNAVEVNKQSSSQVWSGFRVAQRAYPFDLMIDSSVDSLSVQCAHNGYHMLRGSPTHTRRWSIDENKILIEDRVDGGHQSAVSRFILHADVTVKKVSERVLLLTVPNAMELTFYVVCGSAVVISWQHTNEFGSLHATHCIEVSLVNGKSLIELL